MRAERIPKSTSSSNPVVLSDAATDRVLSFESDYMLATKSARQYT